MRSVNKVILIGNLTRDPVLRKTASGQSIVTFGIATNREWNTPEGQKKSLSEYNNLVAWGRLAELCMEYLSKGKLVYIEGYLKTRSWEHEAGVKVFRTEIVAQDMIMLEKKGAGTTAGTHSKENAVSTPNEESALDDLDDDFFADAPSVMDEAASETEAKKEDQGSSESSEEEKTEK